jgi:hypothetical protein
MDSYMDGLLERGEDPTTDYNIRRFMEAHCKITDRGGNRVNLILNEAQILLHDTAEQQLVELGLVRILVEKIRQLGSSTYIDVRILVKTYLRRYIQALIISHIQKSTNHLYRITSFAWNNLPLKMRRDRPLVTPKPTQEGFEFAPPHNSIVQIGTAGSLDIGHSFTFQLMHGSECARWPNAGQLLEGIDNAIHYVPGTEKWFETTADPTGRWFKLLFEEALDDNNEYKALFLGLLKFCFYSIPHIPDKDRKRPKKQWRPDEIKFQIDHKVPDDIMVVAISKKRSAACQDRWGPFNRQFPVTHEIAWDMPDECMFNLDTLKAMEKEELRDPVRRGDLEFDCEEVGSTVSLNEDVKLPLFEIYEEPDYQADYIITADFAEGVGGDYHVLDCWKVILGGRFAQLEQVAHSYNNWVETYIVALDAFKLGVFFNWAYQCPESNKEGLLGVKTLQKGFAGWPQTDGGYPYIYTQVKQQSKDEKPMDKLGWHTGGSTKKLLIEDLRIWLLNRQLIIRCKRTIDELKGFYWDALKKDYVMVHKHADAKDYHDDEVITAAIAPQAFAEWEKRPRLMGRAAGWRM